MRDVVPRLHLTVRLADFRQHSLLIRNVGFNRVRDEKVRASPGNLCQPSQPLLDLRVEPDTEGRAACVRHEHMVSRTLSRMCFVTPRVITDCRTALASIALAV